MPVLEKVRQLRYPREFRIAAAPWPSDLEQMLARLVTPPGGAQTELKSGLGEQELRLLADVGTGLWRLKQKMVKPGTEQPLDEMRRPYRHLESVWDALKQAGVVIQDHTDTRFDEGMSLTVIAYQPTPGLSQQRVLETIKPSIYLKTQRIQKGEVIVGDPERATGGLQSEGQRRDG
jgi:hypothetical protein